jgi:hypothetical protein
MKTYWDDHCCGSHTETNDQTANGHLSERVSCSLQDGTYDKQKASHVNCTLSPKSIGGKTSCNSADESSSRGNGGDKFFFASVQSLAEVLIEVDENSGNDSSIITYFRVSKGFSLFGMENAHRKGDRQHRR